MLHVELSLFISATPPTSSELLDDQWLGVTVASQGSGKKAVVNIHRTLNILLYYFFSLQSNVFLGWFLQFQYNMNRQQLYHSILSLLSLLTFHYSKHIFPFLFPSSVNKIHINIIANSVFFAYSILLNLNVFFCLYTLSIELQY